MQSPEKRGGDGAKDMPSNPILVPCLIAIGPFPCTGISIVHLILQNNQGISVAWSNEAFELWYLLHFNYHDTGLNRAEYGERLRVLLGGPYNKADDQIYAKLKDRQPTAMKHALRLEKHWIEMGGCNPEKANPSTSVHKLVAFLNQFQELGPADND